VNGHRELRRNNVIVRYVQIKLRIGRFLCLFAGKRIGVTLERRTYYYDNDDAKMHTLHLIET